MVLTKRSAASGDENANAPENFKQSGRTPVLEEARTMDYVTNHNMITMAMSIFKTLNMAAECGGM